MLLRIKKYRVLTLLFLLPCHLLSAQQKYPFELFRPKEVRLLDGVFKHAELKDLDYMLAINVNRLLAPFLREAGLRSAVDSYTNWEKTGLDGHYLTALSLMYAVQSDLS